MAYKHLIFDFGNVLFDLDLPRIEQELRRLSGPDFEAAREKLQRDRVFELYETGGLSTAEFVDALRFAGPVPISAADITAAWNSIFIEMPRRRFELLLQLRQRYQVFLLSNINELHERWIADYMQREHGIHDFEHRYFDAVYYSHLIRLRKPDREIYEYVLADAEILPEESLFIDDLEVNVEAARKLGIHAELKQAEEPLEMLLSRLLVL
ncbi:MAG: HAD family phosphatase [Chitinophagales bacterium]|nr:HAD family phosphatase [Chitinophagales bacterium]